MHYEVILLSAIPIVLILFEVSARYFDFSGRLRIRIYYPFVLNVLAKIKQVAIPRSMYHKFNDSLCRDSIGFEIKNIPIFVRVKHLKYKGWPDKAFLIVLLMNRLKIIKKQVRKGVLTTLKLDLKDQQYGIYNNDGKKYIGEAFGVSKEENVDRLIYLSEDIEAFLNPKHEKLEYELDLLKNDAPLRWASGGVLAITRYDGRQWAVLMFRDIQARGWNIANGASESLNETRNIRNLIYREFSEEVMLFDSRPEKKTYTKQKVFYIPNLPEDLNKRIVNLEFSQLHQELRRQEDELLFEHESDEDFFVPIDSLKTKQRLELEFRGRGGRDQRRSFKNIIFNINPAEFGIEVVMVLTFEMDNSDYLLDGEILEFGPTLARRPVMLLSIEYLKALFTQTGTLGQRLDRAPSMDCKLLEFIPRSEYRLFDYDIEMRKRRLSWLKKNHPQKTQEIRFHEGWLHDYGPMFKRASEGDGIHAKDSAPIATLCPVTWKTLERMFLDQLI